MGRVISIANQKGGVGKTTTAINLSACLSEIGQKVLTIDIDPQGNTTSGLGVDKHAVENNVYALLLGENTIEECIIETEIKNQSLISSDVNLAGAEIELIGIDEKEYILKKAISKIKAIDKTYHTFFISVYLFLYKKAMCAGISPVRTLHFLIPSRP